MSCASGSLVGEVAMSDRGGDDTGVMGGGMSMMVLGLWRGWGYIWLSGLWWYHTITYSIELITENNLYLPNV